MAPPRPRLTPALALLAALVAAGCGGDEPAAATAPEGPVTEITITSPDLRFDIEAFEVPVGEPVTITYDNTDTGVAHNLRVDTGTDPEPVTELAVGPDTQELTFTLGEAGDVTYLCDLHPVMRGTITAS